MLQLFLRKQVLLRDWIALGHHFSSFNSVVCRKHKWVLFDSRQLWNIQKLSNPETGEAEYWVSQKCRCKNCGTVRNFPLIQIKFNWPYDTK